MSVYLCVGFFYYEYEIHQKSVYFNNTYSFPPYLTNSHIELSVVVL